MENKPSILVVDDELIVRDSLSDWLAEDGYNVSTVKNGKEAIKSVKETDWDVLLVDLKMPGLSGLDVLSKVKEINPNTPVIIMTAYATVDTAVEAIKKGAYDYITKPFNPEEITLTLRKIIAHQKLIKENILLRDELKKRYHLGNIIGKSPKMLKVFEFVRMVANTKSNVLITGESGTGKEVIARAIHETGDRKDGPFIAVSCAALPDTLLESELFGYEKGAFTGAANSRKGKIELADKGTLFLDEIGEISTKTQLDLLRFLEERKFRRLGGEKLIEVDVRIITATNRDLELAIKQGIFRSDLYYRLNVVKIHLPPLRERKPDIPLLAHHFLEKYRLENKKEIEGFSPEALNLLIEYNWNGNVRELENVIERATVVSKESLITPKDLPDNVRKKKTPEFVGVSSLEDIEKHYIKQVLEETNWNIKISAQKLGIARSSLYRKIRKYKIKSQRGKILM